MRKRQQLPGTVDNVAHQSERIPANAEPGLSPPLYIGHVAKLIGCLSLYCEAIPRGLPHFRSSTGGRLIFYQAQVIG